MPEHLPLEAFAQLNYESFRVLARRQELSEHERVGFPDSFRAGRVEAILADIVSKLLPQSQPGEIYLDIGPGCSSLAVRLVEEALQRGLEVHLVDSPEMLEQLSEWPQVRRHAGKFPEEVPELLERLQGRVHFLLAYSVGHYAFAEGKLTNFVAFALSLLSPGGRFLLGDLPNESKRRRFFDSPRGREFQARFIQEHGLAPATAPDRGALERLDDRVLSGLVATARQQGFDAYWLPQPPELPMANRREDLLFVRP